MHPFKKLRILYFLLVLFNSFFINCQSEKNSTSFCGKIPIQDNFPSSNSTVFSYLNQMILCKSNKLYFRTSLGLFQISSIDYKIKTLTIPHNSCSPSDKFVSPSLLSSGFPNSGIPNSLLLFNCSTKNNPNTSIFRNCTNFQACLPNSKAQNQESHSCLFVNDIENLDKGFHPKDFNCSHYKRVYKNSLNNNDKIGYELGTRISFDIPDHVPNICDECEKSNGNCGVGLRCICHPQECKDKVISVAGSVKSFGNNFIFTVLLSVILELIFSL